MSVDARCEALDKRLVPGTRVTISHPVSDLENQLIKLDYDFSFDRWAFTGSGHYAVVSEGNNSPGYMVHPESLSIL